MILLTAHRVECLLLQARRQAAFLELSSQGQGQASQGNIIDGVL